MLYVKVDVCYVPVCWGKAEGNKEVGKADTVHWAPRGAGKNTCLWLCPARKTWVKT